MDSLRSNRRRARIVALALAAIAAMGVIPLRAQATLAGKHVPFEAASPDRYRAGPTGPAWSETIEHPGASFIAVHFDRFDLGPRDRVVVRSESGDQRYRFTGRGKGNRGAFWATHIKGDKAIIELFAARRGGRGQGVSIDKYSAGIVDKALGGAEEVCYGDDRKNAACYTTSEPEIYDGARAVARLLTHKGASSFYCTGWLVGCQGHLITNEHCITTQDHADDTDYDFMSEAPTCPSGNGQGQWAGTVWAGAATLLQDSPPLDYAFILLGDNPQETFGSYFLDNRSVVPDERIYIPQHPSGWAKQFAVTSLAPGDESGFCEVINDTQPPCSGGPGDVGYWCDSIGGTSGSPVVAYSNHQVVALHHCRGNADNCGDPNRGVPITAVISDLGGMLPACALNPTPNLRYESHTVDDPAGNNNGAADPGETLALPVDLRNNGTALGTGLSATLSSTTFGVTIVDGTATWADTPAGGLRTSDAPHFTVELASSIPCASLVDFDLAISGDQGSYGSSFQMLVGTDLFVQAPSTDTPTAIPDINPTGITSSLFVPSSFDIADLNVEVHITHSVRSQLVVDLVSPMGTTVTLHNMSTGTNNINTTYDALTPPDGPGTMDDFNGEDVQGTWELRVRDMVAGVSGTLSSWTLLAEPDPRIVCSGEGCAITAALTADPSPNCLGTPSVLSGGLSSYFGDDCSGVLEYRFEEGPTLLRDWSIDPDFAHAPAATTTYTLRARDQATLDEDDETLLLEVFAFGPPTTTVVQSPDPACTEVGTITLTVGTAFASYTWRDGESIVVGTTPQVVLGPGDCGETFTVEIWNYSGCATIVPHVVACEPCGPPEVSPAGSSVPFRMGVDALGSVEFELLDVPDVAYHLWFAYTGAEILAGDYALKFCDLEVNVLGTWTPVDATTVRWTPVVPALLFPGYWVVVAEERAVGFEGLYGVQTGGTPRPRDADGIGRDGNHGCGP